MRYAKPILRLTVFFAACAAVLAYLDYRSAEASVMDHLLGIGQRMAPYLDDGRGAERPRQVRINGVPLFVAAGYTQHPPGFVRRWYADRYAARGDGLDAVGLELKKKGAFPPQTPPLNELSFGNDNKGGVAALDFGEKLSVRALRERLLRYVRSGDLGELARLRYVYYEKAPGGGTRYLTVWTDEHMQLAKLMPTENRDADGSDVAGVPRYPGTVRVLSAEEHGMPQKVAVYDGPGSPETAELFYRARLKTLGWSCDETFNRLAKRDGKTALRCDNAAGHEVLVDVTAPEGGGITVCVIQSR
jgi:hypothetical protein